MDKNEICEAIVAYCVKENPQKTAEEVKAELANVIHDIQLLDDPDNYIVMKRWCRDDVAGCLIEDGIAPSEENIDAVINTGMLKALSDCDDGDWEIIHSAINEAKNHGNLTC